MNFYKTARWLRVRERVLRRDDYMCRECRRYGKTTAATTVHHVYPREQYPELRYSANNLISLCAACHNAMHNRDDNSLTDAGRAWCERTPPPSRPKIP